MPRLVVVLTCCASQIRKPSPLGATHTPATILNTSWPKPGAVDAVTIVVPDGSVKPPLPTVHTSEPSATLYSVT